MIVLKLLAGKDEVLLVGRNAFFIMNLGFHVVNGVSEDETLPIGGNAFFVLNLGLHIVDRVRRLNFQGYRFPCKKDLHTSTEAKDEIREG